MSTYNINYKVAKSDIELQAAYKLRHMVFIVENKVINDNHQIYNDEWDNHAYHMFAEINNKIVSYGRLIKNSSIGFRVSSSINLMNYFSDLDNVFEISGLSVDENFRHLGIANAIHYFRILLAKKFSGQFIIASCFRETSVHLINLGFEVLVDEFYYKQYKSIEPSMLLSFSLNENHSSLATLNNYITTKITEAEINIIKNSVLHFNDFPINKA